jgi:hypothetical protein
MEVMRLHDQLLKISFTRIHEKSMKAGALDDV